MVMFSFQSVGWSPASTYNYIILSFSTKVKSRFLSIKLQRQSIAKKIAHNLVNKVSKINNFDKNSRKIKIFTKF